MIGVGPYVVPVTLYVHGKHVYRIHPFRGQVIQCTDYPLPFTSLPGGIPFFPVCQMWSIPVQAPAGVRLSFPQLFPQVVPQGLVEIPECQKIFRTVGPVFYPGLTRSLEYEISLSSIDDPSSGPEIGSFLIRRIDTECPCCSVRSHGTSGHGITFHRNVLALAEPDRISPLPGFIGPEMHLPDIT